MRRLVTIYGAVLLAGWSCDDSPVTDDSVGGSGSGFPFLGLTPERVIDFGSVANGAVAEQTLVIANVGVAPLEIETVASGDAAIVVDWKAPQSIDPAEHVEVPVRWSPTTFADLEGSLQISTNDTVRPLAELALVGVTPDPDIDLTPPTWDFGSVDVGTTSVMGVSIANVGEGPLTVTSLDYVASDGDLTIDDVTLPFVVAPNDSVDLRVTYKPTSNGTDAATLQVGSDDPDEPQVTAAQNGTAVIDFDAFDDFDVVANDETHVWQYGSAPSAGGELSLFPWAVESLPGVIGWADGSGTTGDVGKNTTGEDLNDADTPSHTVLPGAVFLHIHPGSQSNARYSVLRFVVPETATWTIDCAFKSLQVGTATSTDAHVFVSGVEVFVASVGGYYDTDPTAGETYVDALPLKAGETVDFAVGPGPGANYIADNTGVRATLTLE